MAAPDTCSYYIGLGIATIVGYLLSSLHLERLIVAAIVLFSEWVSGRTVKKRIIAAEENDREEAEEHEAYLSATTITSGWTDESVFELERRAIFSKAWLFVTHTSRFQKPGDYRTYDIAGFSFIVILGKDKQLRAFHNVCRHRAYAVTKKECGSSTVLGCRYHGWSYDTKGSLIKAPEFDSVPGFDKKKNALWEVKTSIREGILFVNLDAGRDIEVLSLGEPELVLRGWGMTTMKCAADWKVEVAVNWKCLGSLDSTKDPHENSGLLSILPFPFQRRNKDLRISSTTIVRRLASGTLVILALFPKSAKSTIIDCSVFARKSPNPAALEKLKIRTASTIDQLIMKPQELHSQGAPAAFVSAAQQLEINKLLEMHLDAEGRVGAEIHPAARSQDFNIEGKADDDFCKELDGGGDSICSANAKGLLDW